MRKIYLFICCVALLTYSCRKAEEIIAPTTTPVSTGQSGPIKGFYLLNEGNMGSNKA